MDIIYMDNSATTPLCEEAKAAIIAAFDNFGNPSSLHTLGLQAEKTVRKSSEVLLSVLKDKGKGKIIFASSGTEANNLALFGTAYAKKSNYGKKIIITDSEHPSVSSCAEELEKRGFPVVKIPTKNGVIDEGALLSAVDEKTFLVSIMTANNETGAVYDIKKLNKLCKAANPDVLFHTDATQGFMKTNVSAKELGVDMITVSGHKIGAPKGIGVLYISADVLRRKAISPHTYGGGQQDNIRSGTENVIYISALAAAVNAGVARFGENVEKMAAMRDYLTNALSKIEGVRVNIPLGMRLPSIVSVTVKGIRSETMLHSLSSKKIYVSSGSACSSHHKGVSGAMTAFGLSADEADSTIRISLAPYNTHEECDAVIKAVEESVKTLAKKTQ